MDYITGEKNKAFLWSMLYENNFFVGVPNNKLAHVKLLFESTISNISKNSGNKNILDINKDIIQSFNSQIQNLKKNLS